MELQGTVAVIGNTEQVSDKFKKRNLVIITKDNPTYPQHISLEATQDKVNLFDNLQVGQDVNCSINIKGRSWTSPKGETKYFNTLEVWKVSSEEAKGISPNKSFVSTTTADGSDLPF